MVYHFYAPPGCIMKVAILVFPGVEELDFVGFSEALATANRVSGSEPLWMKLSQVEQLLSAW
jgi:transcriptional regulator GlxA family with amidase domain